MGNLPAPSEFQSLSLRGITAYVLAAMRIIEPMLKSVLLIDLVEESLNCMGIVASQSTEIKLDVDVPLALASRVLRSNTRSGLTQDEHDPGLALVSSLMVVYYSLKLISDPRNRLRIMELQFKEAARVGERVLWCFVVSQADAVRSELRSTYERLARERKL